MGEAFVLYMRDTKREKYLLEFINEPNKLSWAIMEEGSPMAFSTWT